MDESDWNTVRIPLIAATIAAFYFSSRFVMYLPISDGWVTIETVLMPLAYLNIAFHEAGHVVFGFFGFDFLRVAGGTLMQLLLPTACGVHFLFQESRAGVAFALFWIGENLITISLYAADAQSQSLILITGMSGREGGGHDWGYMLQYLNQLKNCVPIGRAFFFCGVWLMVFSLAWFFFLAKSLTHKSY